MRNDDFYDIYDDDDAIPLKKRQKKVTGSGTAMRREAETAAPRVAPRQIPNRTAARTPASSGAADRTAAQRPATAAPQVRRPAGQTAGTKPAVKSAVRQPAAAQTKSASAGRSPAPAGNASRADVARGVDRMPGKAAQNSASGGGLKQKNQISQRSAQSAAGAAAAPQRQTPQRASNAQKASSSGGDSTPVEMPVRTNSSVRSSRRGLVSADEKKGGAFKKGYLIYLAVLILLSAIFLIYVHGLLADFEASQVDNVVAEKLESIKKAASKGKLETEMSLDEIKEKYSPSEEELEDFEKAFSLGELTYKKARAGLSADTETYDIYLNGFLMGDMVLRTLKEDTVLAIFPVTEWAIESCSAKTFSFDFPASVTVSAGTQKIEGKPSETAGLYSYTVSSLFNPDTFIIDSAGNTASFNGKDPITFVNYTVKVFSTYSVYSGDKLIDPAKAETTEIDEYEYVREYCDAVPALSTYRLCLIDDGGKITVKDQSGADVEYTQKDTLIEAHTMPTSDTMPQGLADTIDPLAIAEAFSLITSDDLGGEWPHGFNKLANYLIKDSYFYEKNYEFATSVDITFVSDHTLDNPPFNSEEVSEYVKFSDECFSCRIKFNKPMHMANGVNKVDVVDSTYYFVYYDDSEDGIDNPHWALVDTRGQAKKIN